MIFIITSFFALGCKSFSHHKRRADIKTPWRCYFIYSKLYKIICF